MRNALILLAVVALLILAVGALNNGTAFDVDYVAGTVSAVSLFWVSAVLAALVFVVGLAAAWFAQAAVAGSRRKLEAELQSTYERLREAEALAARPAPAAVDGGRGGRRDGRGRGGPSSRRRRGHRRGRRGRHRCVVAARTRPSSRTRTATVVADEPETGVTPPTDAGRAGGADRGHHGGRTPASDGEAAPAGRRRTATTAEAAARAGRRRAGRPGS